MPRVKRGNKRRLKRKKILRRAKGYYLAKSKLYRIAKEQVRRSLRFAYRDRQAEKATVPPAVDRADQRGRPPARHVLLPADARPEGRRRPAGPQGARRHRRSRPGRLRPGRQAQPSRHSRRLSEAGNAWRPGQRIEREFDEALADGGCRSGRRSKPSACATSAARANCPA